MRIGSRDVSASLILLGLLEGSTDEHARILQKLGMDVEALYNEIETKAIGRANQSWPSGTSLTEDSKLAIAYAMEEMKKLGQEAITPGHLLLGVLRASSDVRDSFISRGADTDAVRKAFQDLLDARSA